MRDKAANVIATAGIVRANASDGRAFHRSCEPKEHLIVSTAQDDLINTGR
jgi:hypothetical protein